MMFITMVVILIRSNLNFHMSFKALTLLCCLGEQLLEFINFVYKRNKRKQIARFVVFCSAQILFSVTHYNISTIAAFVIG